VIRDVRRSKSFTHTDDLEKGQPVIYFLALLLTLAVPLLGGFVSVHIVDSNVNAKEKRYLHKSLSIIAEIAFLASPGVILMMFGFLSPTATLWIVLGCVVLFGMALRIHNGNDVESFAVCAILAILIPHSVIAVSHAYAVHQGRNDTGTMQESTSNATNKAVNPSGGSGGK
jgi:membrane-bound ClpP family serine protease